MSYFDGGNRQNQNRFRPCRKGVGDCGTSTAAELAGASLCTSTNTMNAPSVVADKRQRSRIPLSVIKDMEEGPLMDLYERWTTKSPDVTMRVATVCEFELSWEQRTPREAFSS